ncbi:MAG: hypothetical protein ACI9W2_000925 [Gammaproteobacteria bacterium]|jgi:hypothetical protein
MGLSVLLNSSVSELFGSHGQVFEKARERKPREKDYGFSGVQCLWGLSVDR